MCIQSAFAGITSCTLHTQIHLQMVLLIKVKVVHVLHQTRREQNINRLCCTCMQMDKDPPEAANDMK